MTSKTEIATQKFAAQGLDLAGLTFSPRDYRSVKYIRHSPSRILLDISLSVRDWPDDIFGDLMAFIAVKINGGDAMYSPRLREYVDSTKGEYA